MTNLMGHCTPTLVVAIGLLIGAPLAAQETTPEPPGPPVMTVTEKDTPSSKADPAYWIFARVFGGQRELWSGHLAMTPYGRAAVHTDVQEMDSNCPVKNNRYAPRRNTIELQIRPGRQEGEALYRVEVRWTRPAKNCSQRGTRAAGFEIDVELVDNETRVMNGDGGLRLEITRIP